MIRVSLATSENDFQRTRALIRDYAASLGVDLCFQGLEEELAGLPGAYEEPAGCMLLGLVDHEPLGLVALKPLPTIARAAEMKRLYVRPQGRGLGLGRLLVEGVCQQAREKGYQAIYLDTLPTMHEAQAMYRSMGFQNTEAYVYNPIEGTQYLRLYLRSDGDTLFEG